MESLKVTTKDLEFELYKNDIIFSFSGSISYNILSAISLSVKNELNSMDGSNKEIYNVYYVFIELVQNIMNYSYRRDEESKSGTGTCFVIHHKNSKKFKVCAGNVISSEQARKIKTKLDKINSLNKEELKEFYKISRREGTNTHEKGGGLGFIEIARKSNEKLEYRITKIDNEIYYFEITVHI